MDQLRRKVILIGVIGYASLVDAVRAQAPAPAGATSAPAAPQAPAPATPQAPAPSGSQAPSAPDAKPAWAYLVPVVGPLISGALAFVGVTMGLRVGERNTASTIRAATLSSQASVWQKANEAELDAIESKLEGFYGPFVQLSGINRLLAGDLRSRVGHDPDFRLMTALFEPGWLEGLSPADAQVVKQICSNAERLERLVEEKAGAVDEALAPYLARVATHFRMLQLAGAGQLGDDATPFERYKYPRQLDGVIEREIERLRRRITALRASPASPAGPMHPLEIPRELELDPWPGIPTAERRPPRPDRLTSSR